MKRSFSLSQLIPAVSLKLMWVSALPLFAEDSDIEALRAEIARQQAQLEAQSRQLAQQAESLKRLEKMIEAKAPKPAPAVATHSPSPAPSSSSGAKSGITPIAPAPVESLKFPEEIPLADRSEILDVAPIAGLGRGEKFVDSDFLKSTPLFGSDWRFSFGGYAKVDLLHDFSGSGDSSQFLISQIPVDGTLESGSYSDLQLRETRFNFEVRNTSEGAPENKAYLEFDLFDLGNSSSPRLRHAYFQYGNLLVGQTWTTLTELRQLPLMLDFAAGDSLFGGRTVQVRWEQEINRQFDWAIALEDFSDSGIQNLAGLSGTARSNFPLLVGRVSYDWGGGLVMLGGSVGENRWDGSDGISDDAAFRWNIATGGRVYLTDEKTHFFGFGASIGQGSPRDILTFGNAGTPSAVLDADGNVQNIDSWNAHMGLHLRWNDKFSSNFNVAYAALGNTSLLPDEATKNGGAVHGNIIYDFNEQLRVGLEVMFGEQELVNGRSGTAQRVQASVFYYF